MRPDGLESIRAVQTALAEVIVPELQTPFARDTAQTLNMLLESVASSWDGIVSDPRRDNEALIALLFGLGQVLREDHGDEDEWASLVQDIDGVLSVSGDESDSVSWLAERNRRLNEVLESGLERIESVVGEPGYVSLHGVRKEIYEHLREVAGRGWSFWDVASFREYMAKHRGESE